LHFMTKFFRPYPGPTPQPVCIYHMTHFISILKFLTVEAAFCYHSGPHHNSKKLTE
jgi:hypothetical protein